MTYVNPIGPGYYQPYYHVPHYERPCTCDICPHCGGVRRNRTWFNVTTTDTLTNVSGCASTELAQVSDPPPQEEA